MFSFAKTLSDHLYPFTILNHILEMSAPVEITAPTAATTAANATAVAVANAASANKKYENWTPSQNTFNLAEFDRLMPLIQLYKPSDPTKSTIYFSIPAPTETNKDERSLGVPIEFLNRKTNTGLTFFDKLNTAKKTGKAYDKSGAGMNIEITDEEVKMYAKNGREFGKFLYRVATLLAYNVDMCFSPADAAEIKNDFPDDDMNARIKYICTIYKSKEAMATGPTPDTRDGAVAGAMFKPSAKIKFNIEQTTSLITGVPIYDVNYNMIYYYQDPKLKKETPASTTASASAEEKGFQEAALAATATATATTVVTGQNPAAQPATTVAPTAAPTATIVKSPYPLVPKGCYVDIGDILLGPRIDGKTWSVSTRGAMIRVVAPPKPSESGVARPPPEFRGAAEARARAAAAALTAANNGAQSANTQPGNSTGGIENNNAVTAVTSNPNNNVSSTVGATPAPTQ